MKSGAQLSDNERLNWLRLAQTENVGPVTFHQLITAYKTATAAIEALPDLSARGGRRKALKICTVPEAEAMMARAVSIKAHFVVAGEMDIPPTYNTSPLHHP